MLVDLIICLCVLMLQLIIAESVLRHLLSKMSKTNIKEKQSKFTGIRSTKKLVVVTVICSLVYALLIIFREFIYSKDITDNVLHESLYLNVSFIATIVLTRVLSKELSNRLSTVLNFARFILYAYIALGYGFYYLVFIFRLGLSGLLI